MKNTITILLILYSSFCFAQPGALDGTFGTQGIVVTPSPYPGLTVYAVALQDDSKIITGGRASNGTDRDFILTRYNIDGTLDKSFGNSGFVMVDINGKDDNIREILIQPDGKIIAVGNTNYKPGYSTFSLIRCNQNGTLDSSFGNNGKVLSYSDTSTIYSEFFSQRTCQSAVLQKDGKILVLGNDNNFALARYLPEGKVDSSFGVDGTSANSFYPEDNGWGIALQTDGKILLTGQSGVPLKDQTDSIVLARYLESGLPDNSFGTNGVVFTDLGKGGLGYSITAQPDNKILVGAMILKDGWIGSADQASFAVIRYNSNGTPDNNFGTAGQVITNFPNSSAFLTKIILQKDGKIIATGFVKDTLTDEFSFALARYNSGGVLDNDFGVGGLVVTSFETSTYSYRSGYQQDNKILIAGGNDAGTTFSLARYNNDDVLPITLISFTATPLKNKSVLLSWTTSNEINNSYFTIEKSKDGVNYSSVGIIATNPNQQPQNTYSFTDKQPYTGTSYYRLKQTDKDGKFTYSKVIPINISEIAGLLIKPNPSSNGKFTIDLGDVKKNITIRVKDNAGRMVYSKEIYQAQSISLNLTKPKGIYFLMISYEGGEGESKLLIQ